MIKENLVEFIHACGVPIDTHLRHADLRYADLGDADLRYANLRYADLGDADLRYANLGDANLGDADLRYANLGDANLGDADLRYADLRYADLRHASLRYADLRYADLSSSKGLKSPSTLLRELGFEFTREGLICYKSFSENYDKPLYWNGRKILRETVNMNRTLDCACGVNVATLDWCQKHCSNQIYKCLIKWHWLVDVCVPYHSDGKIRAGKVKILEEIGI